MSKNISIFIRFKNLYKFIKKRILYNIININKIFNTNFVNIISMNSIFFKFLIIDRLISSISIDL